MVEKKIVLVRGKEGRGKGSKRDKRDQKKKSIFFHRTCGRAMTGPHNRTCGARAVLCGITGANGRLGGRGGFIDGVGMGTQVWCMGGLRDGRVYYISVNV